MSIPADNQGYEVPTPSAQVGSADLARFDTKWPGAGGLALRLQAAWQRNTEAPDELALRLVGDESGYEEEANALLHGSFFQSPVRVPIYPLFIAAYTTPSERSPAKTVVYSDVRRRGGGPVDVSAGPALDRGHPCARGGGNRGVR